MRKFFILAFGGLGAFGCTEAPAPVPVDVSAAKIDPVLPTPAPMVPAKVPVAQEPKPVPVELAVKLPDDLGGKAVQKSLMPSMALPDDLTGPKVPRPRSTAIDRGELSTAPLAITLPALPNPKVKPAKPSLPPERIPTDLGRAAAENLSAVKFPEKALVRADGPNNGAADVPLLARQLLERASVEDPTAEISALKLIETIFPYPVGPLPFLKVTIPDPFEFVEQLKGKLPRESEFGTVPSVVPPEKK